MIQELYSVKCLKVSSTQVEFTINTMPGKVILESKIFDVPHIYKNYEEAYRYVKEFDYFLEHARVKKYDE